MISLLMPVRDAERTLAAALDTLVAEPSQDVEFILVDDGSRDDSLGIALRYARHDPRIVVLEREREGLVAALNAGLARCRGEFIGRHDADDLSRPGRLVRQAEYLRRHPMVDLVSTRFETFCDDGPVGMGMRRWENWSNAFTDHQAMYRERFVEAPVAHPSIMMRAAVLRDSGGYRDGDFPEDYELWLRLFSLGRKFARLDEFGLSVREHAARAIHNQPQYRPEAFQNLKIEHLKREFLHGERPVLILGGGRIAKRWVTALVERGVEVAGMVDVNPRRIGKTVRGVPVYSADQIGPDTPLGELRALGAVGRPGGRETIRKALPELGRQEGRDFLFVA
jgi:glycosyltransferase involved in cell wall biosynthesis